MELLVIYSYLLANEYLLGYCHDKSNPLLHRCSFVLGEYSCKKKSVPHLRRDHSSCAFVI